MNLKKNTVYSVPKELNNKDWKEMFRVIKGRITVADDENDRGVSTAYFTPSDVEKVIGLIDGDCCSLKQWFGLFKLRDGRFAYVVGDINSEKCTDKNCKAYFENESTAAMAFALVARSADALREDMYPGVRSRFGL